MATSSKNLLRYIAIFTAFIGLAFLGVGGFSLWEEFSSLSWPSVEGTVVQSEVKRSSRRKSEYDYRLQFLYQYQVADKAFTSDRIGTGRNRVKSRMAGEEALSSYPVGKRITVYYHPQHPERALLKTGVRFATVLKACLGLFLLCGGLGFALIKR